MKRYLLTIGVAMLFACSTLAAEIHCPGEYDGHLQGIALDDDGNIYWSFTVALVKTDAQGKLLKEIAVPTHHGDLWVEDGMVYVAVNLGKFNEEAGQADSWIYAYKADDLALEWKKAVPEVVHGAGGITMRDGHCFVIGGLPKGYEENYVYEYDADANFIARHVLDSGYTYLGIQTAAYADGTWWFGCYGAPQETLRASGDLVFEEKFDYECALGIAPLPGGGFLIGRNKRNEERKYTGWVITVETPNGATTE
jgi:hypothetical protein